MNSKEKLAQALEQYKEARTTLTKCPLTAEQIKGIDQLIVNARNGDYSDYDSKHALPQTEFVRQWDKLGLPSRTDDSIAYRMTQGEFDGTKEESDAWFEREGREIMEREIPKEMWNMFERSEEETESKEGIKGWDI